MFGCVRSVSKMAHGKRGHGFEFYALLRLLVLVSLYKFQK
jgi:hypothetical protein